MKLATIFHAQGAPRWVAGASWAAIVLGTVVEFLGRGAAAPLWDDALFFRRLGHHLVDHRVAAWNLQDGPVYMATSQLYQAVAALWVALAPHHFTAASVLGAAVCLVATFATLGAAAQEASERAWPLDRAVVLLVALQAPPLLLSAVTGMETCLVVWVLSFFLWLLVHPTWGRHEGVLALASGLVYLARPDAVLLAVGAALGVLTSVRSMVRFGTFVGLTLAVCIGAAWAYYGTPFPLAAYLKVGPFSVYDADYKGLDLPGKLQNLRQVGLVALPLLPLVLARRDRLNFALAGTSVAFVAFHALTTVEIMAYHARFYVLAWPLWVLAALRGLPLAQRHPKGWLCASTVAVGWVALAYSRGWIENVTQGYVFNFVSARTYAHYFVGMLAVSALALSREVIQRNGHWAVVLGLGVLAVAAVPRGEAWARDEVIDEYALSSDGSLKGLADIRRCFPEPVSLVHSELGVPGVMLLESRVVDYTGLANPAVAHGTFDFEAFCADETPQFIFRPHWTHRRLNAQLAQSDCLKERYLPAEGNNALLVRSDLRAQWNACTMGRPPQSTP